MTRSEKSGQVVNGGMVPPPAPQPRKKLSDAERKRRRRRSAHGAHLRKTYGLRGIEDYDLLFAYGLGKCWTYGGGTSRRFLAVDHNHRNGNVRGLLCANCNQILARARDRVEVLERLIKHLKDDGETVRRILQ